MATYSHDDRRRRMQHEDWLQLCRALDALGAAAVA